MKRNSNSASEKQNREKDLVASMYSEELAKLPVENKPVTNNEQKLVLTDDTSLKTRCLC